MGPGKHGSSHLGTKVVCAVFGPREPRFRHRELFDRASLEAAMGQNFRITWRTSAGLEHVLFFHIPI